jgi:hypothetical protein
LIDKQVGLVIFGNQQPLQREATVNPRSVEAALPKINYSIQETNMTMPRFLSSAAFTQRLAPTMVGLQCAPEGSYLSDAVTEKATMANDR